MENYFKDPRMSQSKLKAYIKCPNLYKWKHVDGMCDDDPLSPELIFGKAVDVLVLTPENFDDEFRVVKQRKRGTVGTLVDGKYELTRGQSKEIHATADRVLRQPVMKKFSWMDPQVAFFTKDKKGLLDLFGIKGKTAHIVDLKTCADLNKFEYSIEDYGYRLQMQYYKELVLANCPNVKRFKMYWVVVDKTPSNKFAVYEVDQKKLRIEKSLIDRTLEAMKTGKRMVKGLCTDCPTDVKCEYSEFKEEHITKL